MAKSIRKHMTAEGPKDCTAPTIEECRAICPNGGKPEHFDTPEEAEKEWQNRLEKTYGETNTVFKKNNKLKDNRFTAAKEDFVVHPKNAENRFTVQNSAIRAEKSNRGVTLDLHNKAITDALKAAPVYKKSAICTVRKAKVGEKLDTVLKDGTKETSRILKGGEIIVKNPSGEEYAMDNKKFMSSYEKNVNGEWQAKGEVKAIKNPTGKNITIMAPWGEEQHGDKKCYIACSAEDNKDRYIIGNKEFKDTYKIK